MGTPALGVNCDWTESPTRPLCPDLAPLTEEAALMDLTAASNTFLGRRRLVVPLSTMLLS